jgi:eukaryotic-like serine/threonine-protein kinase
MDHLAAYARQCLAEDVSAVVTQFYVLLRGRLGDRLRDLTFCRQRLRHVQEALAAAEHDSLAADADADAAPRNGYGSAAGVDASPTPLTSTDSYWESIRESATNRVVLPDNADQLERAAERFVDRLTADQWGQIDQAFQDQVLAVRGGLFRACMDTNDLIRHFAAPLITQAVTSLGEFLPITDVAQVELAPGGADDYDAAGRVLAYHAHAAPLVSTAARGVPAAVRNGPEPPMAPTPGVPAAEEAFLLIPASEAGKRYGEEAKDVLPRVHLVNVPGQADLMFCREQQAITADDLERILRPCRAAYEDAATTPLSSPHARFDIQDWTPLDP